MFLTSKVFHCIQHFARVLAGSIFIGAGVLKSLVPFGEFLEQLNAPFAPFIGVAVPFLEIVGGAILLLHQRVPVLLVRLAALTLAIDMAFALILVGVPGLRGTSHRFENFQIGDEVWRVPLEVFLLLTTLWIALRGTNRDAERTSSTR